MAKRKGKSDFTGNEAKYESRLANLQAAKASWVLLPPVHPDRPGGSLINRDWVEVGIGNGAPSLDLIEPLLNPHTDSWFIGVDNDPAVISACREKHKGRKAKWIEGDVVTLLRRGHPDMVNVGVLNYDLWDGPGEATKMKLVTLNELVKQRQLYGHFLLLINISAVRWKGGAPQAHAWIAETFPEIFPKGIFPRDLTKYTYVSSKTPMINVPIGFGFDPEATLTSQGFWNPYQEEAAL